MTQNVIFPSNSQNGLIGDLKFTGSQIALISPPCVSYLIEILAASNKNTAKTKLNSDVFVEVPRLVILGSQKPSSDTSHVPWKHFILWIFLQLYSSFSSNFLTPYHLSRKFYGSSRRGGIGHCRTMKSPSINKSTHHQHLDVFIESVPKAEGALPTQVRTEKIVLTADFTVESQALSPGVPVRMTNIASCSVSMYLT